MHESVVFSYRTKPRAVTFYYGLPRMRPQTSTTQKKSNDDNKRPESRQEKLKVFGLFGLE